MSIAQGLHKVLAAGFNSCTGAIDGVLIWIHKPSKKTAGTLAAMKVNSIVVGRKNLVSIVRLCVTFEVGSWTFQFCIQD